MQEIFTKDLWKLNKQTEMNNILEGIHSRITEAEAWINDMKDRMVEITATEQNIEKRMKRHEDSLRDFWDNITPTNIHIIGVSEEEKRERTWENIWRDNSWKLSKLGKGNSQVQEAQSPRKDKPKEEHTKTRGHWTDKN